ncbi:MAG: UDP-2,3-diacylglucosamine diphosphatase [Thioalkalispiraceae bacterium]|jgi:UDP-2,3-diacylglucosamine pyrophosphatase LpxH
MTPIYPVRPLKYRSIWISDVHLGYKGCKAEFLLDFLRATETEYLYLVGDIIDVWSMKRTMFWPQSHNNVIRTILGKAKHGTKVIYIPGNHDEEFRGYDGMVFGNVEIHTEYTHTTADGRTVHMLHGDKYDSLMQCSKLTEFVGNLSYDFILYANRILDKLRHKLGFPFWSLAKFIKGKVKNAMAHIRKYENIVATDAKKHGYDVVVCGHIHHADIRSIDGVMYCNDGDWIEHCTALVEKQDGQIELIHWSDRQIALKADTEAQHEIPQVA